MTRRTFSLKWTEFVRGRCLGLEGGGGWSSHPTGEVTPVSLLEQMALSQILTSFRRLYESSAIIKVSTSSEIHAHLYVRIVVIVLEK